METLDSAPPVNTIKKESAVMKKYLMAGVLAPLSFLSAFVFSSCGPSQADIEKAVGEYIKKNPKVVQDAVRAGRPQPQPQLSLDERIKKAIPVPLNNAPVKGADNAAITIVTFSDFQCPFCSRVNPTVDQVLKDYPGKVRLAFRQHPLPFHQNAMSAAKASLAANEQGKFWELHDLMFANQKDLSDEGIKKLAQQAGLNMKKFEESWKSTKFDAQIEEDVKFAQANQATGTPAFFINGVFLKGAQPITGFKEVIDKLLATPGAGQAANN